jgi:hypothetical protein
MGWATKVIGVLFFAEAEVSYSQYPCGLCLPLSCSVSAGDKAVGVWCYIFIPEPVPAVSHVCRGDVFGSYLSR